MEIDDGGFMTLSPGPNVFASGPDTITVTYAIPPASPCPSASASQLLLLAALLSVAGWLLVRPARAAAA
jgi:hypothetical protein